MFKNFIDFRKKSTDIIEIILGHFTFVGIYKKYGIVIRIQSALFREIPFNALLSFYRLNFQLFSHGKLIR